MRTTEIKISTGVTMPHPEVQYASIRVDVGASAEVGHDEDAGKAADDLHDWLLEVVKGRAAVAVEQYGQHPTVSDRTDGPSAAETVKPALEPKTEPAAKPDGDGPTYEKFTFNKRQFSTQRRGPKAAFDEAVRLLESMGSADELKSYHKQFEGLQGIYAEIGRADFETMLEDLVEKKMEELTASEDGDGKPVPADGDAAALETGNGAAAPASQEAPAAKETSEPEMPIRQLAKKVMDEVGIPKVTEMIKQLGGEKIGDLDETATATLRQQLNAELAVL